MKKNNIIKFRAFTLIEMMLVIAVIAIIASFSLMMYQKTAETARIDKAALEMQHILEAALAYNVDKKHWPKANNANDCSSTSPDVSDFFVKHYIPNQDARSSYGSYFCWSVVDGENDDNSQRLFWVAMKVPKNHKALADRLAARLPNAIATSDPNQVTKQACNTSDCYVRAEVVQPGATSSAKGGMLVAAGNCLETNQRPKACLPLGDGEHHRSIYEIIFNACPDNDVPRVTVVPNFLHMRTNRGSMLGDFAAGRTGDPCVSFTDDNDQQKQRCKVYVQATYCKSAHGGKSCSWPDIKEAPDGKAPHGSEGASYIVTCMPARD